MNACNFFSKKARKAFVHLAKLAKYPFKALDNEIIREVKTIRVNKQKTHTNVVLLL